MAFDKLDYRLEDRVAVITMDDGKVNALSHEMIDALHAALTRAEEEAGAVVLTGRPERLSGGFDLKAMTAGAESAQRLVTAGAELVLRLYEFPRPVVAACNGHALAAGAILLLVSDLRIGATGAYKIGLNEVAIGLPLPIFATELARDRLSKRWFSASVTQAHIFDPEGAREAGYLDLTVTPDTLRAAAVARGETLAALPVHAFSRTKLNERRRTIQYIRETLKDDIALLTGVP